MAGKLSSVSHSPAPWRKEKRADFYTKEAKAAKRCSAEALSYEYLNDHTQLRRDPLLAIACEKLDPQGRDRLHDRPAALAGPATLTDWSCAGDVMRWAQLRTSDRDGA